ncbi:MAG: hypothetical protein WCK59_01650 [Candidatus Falkowbacteria bacterium]
MKNLIICHGDGDGVIAAAAIAKRIGGSISFAITQPFLLNEVKVEEDVDLIYVVDMAINNRDATMTARFISRNDERIALWVDHHQGTEILIDLLGERLHFDLDAPSCPSLLCRIKGYYNIPQEWIDAANACDRPTEFPATELSERYNRAFKVALIDLQYGDKEAISKIQHAFIDELLTQQKSEMITNFGSRYSAIMRVTHAAAESLVEVAPGIGLITLGKAKVDKTLLCLEGYKRFPVVIAQFFSLENGEPITMLATNRKDLNLVKKLNLPGGSAFRVNLNGDHESLLKKILIDLN